MYEENIKQQKSKKSNQYLIRINGLFKEDNTKSSFWGWRSVSLDFLYVHGFERSKALNWVEIEAGKSIFYRKRSTPITQDLIIIVTQAWNVNTCPYQVIMLFLLWSKEIGQTTLWLLLRGITYRSLIRCFQSKIKI